MGPYRSGRVSDGRGGLEIRRGEEDLRNLPPRLVGRHPVVAVGEDHARMLSLDDGARDGHHGVREDHGHSHLDLDVERIVGELDFVVDRPAGCVGRGVRGGRVADGEKHETARVKCVAEA